MYRYMPAGGEGTPTSVRPVLHAASRHRGLFVVCRWYAVGFVVFCLLFITCAREDRYLSSLKETLEAAQDALLRRDAEKYYALLSNRQKMGVPKEGLKGVMEKNSEEVDALAKEIATPKEVKIEAAFAAGADRDFVFVLEEGVWRFDGGPLLPVGPQHPVEAARALLGSITTLRQKLIEDGSLADSYKRWLVESFDRLIADLSGLSRERVVIIDAAAYVVLPSGRRIEFILEGGYWKVSRILPFP